MGGELVGEPADLASAHGVGLAGERERTHPGPTDTAGGQMNIDNGIDLVGALGRLIDALREAGHDALGRSEKFEEARHVGLVEAAGARSPPHRGAISRQRAKRRQSRSYAGRCNRDRARWHRRDGRADRRTARVSIPGAIGR